MDRASFKQLLSPAGGEALQAALALDPREADYLPCFQVLSRRFPAPLARAALETAILRRQAVAKFPLANRLFFTREALEQASAFAVSTYRAERFRPFDRLADLGCSIGGDSLALAAAAPTLGIDRDPLRLALARANLAAAGLGEPAAFLQADLMAPLPLRSSSQTALFFDPARRSAGRRVFSVEQYDPPLSRLLAWLPEFPALAAKISPGVNLAELQPIFSYYPAEVEFISLDGQLKEAALWFGPLRTAARRATLLPGPHSLAADAASGQDRAVPVAEPPRAYLYEPDPAVLRAGLVTDLADLLQATQLDLDIAYLTAETLRPTPFARAWVVEDWFPFGLKRLRAYLRQRQVGQVTVKKRGSPLQPEALIRDLRLHGDQERVVFLTHLRGEPIIVVCWPSTSLGD